MTNEGARPTSNKSKTLTTDGSNAGPVFLRQAKHNMKILQQKLQEGQDLVLTSNEQPPNSMRDQATEAVNSQRSHEYVIGMPIFDPTKASNPVSKDVSKKDLQDSPRFAEEVKPRTNPYNVQQILPVKLYPTHNCIPDEQRPSESALGKRKINSQFKNPRFRHTAMQFTTEQFEIVRSKTPSNYKTFKANNQLYILSDESNSNLIHFDKPRQPSTVQRRCEHKTTTVNSQELLVNPQGF